MNNAAWVVGAIALVAFGQQASQQPADSQKAKSRERRERYARAAVNDAAARVAQAESDLRIAKWLAQHQSEIDGRIPGESYPTMGPRDADERMLLEVGDADYRALGTALGSQKVAVVALPDWTFRAKDPENEERYEFVCEGGVLFDKSNLEVTCITGLRRLRQ